MTRPHDPIWDAIGCTNCGKTVGDLMCFGIKNVNVGCYCDECFAAFRRANRHDPDPRPTLDDIKANRAKRLITRSEERR